MGLMDYLTKHVALFRAVCDQLQSVQCVQWNGPHSKPGANIELCFQPNLLCGFHTHSPCHHHVFILSHPSLPLRMSIIKFLLIFKTCCVDLLGNHSGILTMLSVFFSFCFLFAALALGVTSLCLFTCCTCSL